MSRSTYSSEEEDLDIRVRRYQRAPSPHYVQVREERPRYRTGSVLLAPERSSGTMITTHRSRSRERRSSPPQQMAPVVIENKIINEHSSDDDSDYHHRRHRRRSSSHSRRSSVAAVREELALERVRREYEDLRVRDEDRRLRDEERERAGRRAIRDAHSNAELMQAKMELDNIKRENEKREAERQARRDVERRMLEEEQRKEEEKRRREREAKEAVEKYKLEEAEKAAKEREEKEKFDKEYKLRMTADLVAAGVDEREISNILEKKKVNSTSAEGGARPTYTRMSIRHLDIRVLERRGIAYEIDTSDPSFVLIKRWVPEVEQDALWEATRIIRLEDKKSDKLVLAIDDKKHHHHHKTLGEPEFEWVRKKERRRSKSPGLLMYLAGAKPA